MSDPGLPDAPNPSDEPPGGDPGSVPDRPDDDPRPDPDEPIERGAANVMEELGEGFNEAITGDDTGPARPD